MTERYIPHEVKEAAEKIPEQEKKWDFQIDEKGELRIEGMGDINNPFNEDARSPDEEIGMSKIDRWLETEQDEKGRYIKARFIDKAAFDRYIISALRQGEALTKKLHKNIVERLTGPRIKKEAAASNNLEEFTKQLSDFIDSNSELRGQIFGWDLKQLKGRKNSDAQFRLTVYFENDWAKSGKKKKNFVGTYSEIIDAFERELDKLALPLRVVEV